MKRPLRISVFGGRDITQSVYNQAVELGRKLAEEGWLVYCGGGPGVMEAICRGVAEGGGTSVGILKGDRLEEANEFVTIPLLTNMGITRNALLAYNCDIAVAISGQYGTLSEIAYAGQLKKPVIGLGTWDLPNVIVGESPAEIIDLIKEQSV